MYTLQIELQHTRYPIYIGPGLLAKTDLLKPMLIGRQLMIVTNTTVAPLYLERVKKAFSDYQCDEVILEDGEQHKKLTEVNKIFDALIQKKHTRSTTLLALGGGVIGDMTGFAASCFMRGVNYVQMPTTLLAQVDASIGGKTGVNHVLGKNLIGSFYQPQCVMIDLDFLKSLPARIFQEGLAEVIKCGLIHDAEFYEWLENHITDLLSGNAECLLHAIKRSCEIKASLIEADERELKGKRVLLNFGHTFAHAIENGLGYGKWLHGEAVSVGMLLAAGVSAKIGRLTAAEVSRIRNLLMKAGLPIRLPAEISLKQLLDLMARDKKNVHGQLRLVLLSAIGSAIVTEEVGQDTLLQSIQDY